MICRACKEEREPGAILPDVCVACTSAATDAVQASVPQHRLGDKIKSVTEALGIKQCGGCYARQKKFNSIDFDQSMTKVAAALYDAMTTKGNKDDGNDQ